MAKFAKTDTRPQMVVIQDGEYSSFKVECAANGGKATNLEYPGVWNGSTVMRPHVEVCFTSFDLLPVKPKW